MVLRQSSYRSTVRPAPPCWIYLMAAVVPRTQPCVRFRARSGPRSPEKPERTVANAQMVRCTALDHGFGGPRGGHLVNPPVFRIAQVARFVMSASVRSETRGSARGRLLDQRSRSPP